MNRQAKLFLARNYFLILILLVSLVLLKTFRWDGYGGTNKFDIIGSDGKGYYAYLPAIFIQGNLADLPADPAFTNQINGSNVIKYSSGIALLQLPFFMVAWGYSLLTPGPANPYSASFQLMVALSALLYVFAGLIWLRMLLKHLRFNTTSIAVVVLMIFFGTNLLYYTIMAGRMSHAYSFSLITLFCLLIARYFSDHKAKDLYLSAAVFGLIILIRPVNAIIIFLVPFLAGSLQNLLSGVRNLFKNSKSAVISALIVSAIAMIQPLLWYLQCGQWFIQPYAGEGFYFLSPEISNVLFSFRKGLFIYTPLTLISLTGLAVLFRVNRYLFFTMTLFLTAITWLIASWWNWYYGDGFGLRAFIDFYAVFAILLAFLMDAITKRVHRVILHTLLLLILFLSLFQTWQYYMGIIHAFDMNARKYAWVFLRTHEDYRFALGGNRDIQPYSKEPGMLILQTFNDFEHPYPGWTNGIVVTRPKPVKPDNQCTKYGQNEFGVAFTAGGDSLFLEARTLYVKASLRRLEHTLHSSSDALLVADIRNEDGENLYYYSFRINDTPDHSPGTWRKFKYSFVLPALDSFEDKIHIYIWNQARQHFLVDDFSIEIYAIY